MNIFQFIIKILPSAVEIVKTIINKKKEKKDNGNTTTEVNNL